MVRRPPFPYPGGRFPSELGAVIQRTVVEGREPARLVIHDGEGDWMIGDGLTDPNAPGASVATHVTHVLALNPDLAELATMEPGHQAARSEPGEPWRITAHQYDED